MCNYCGCRAISTIALLTDEHVRVGDLVDEVRRAHAGGALSEAQAALSALRELLGTHSAVEELVVYPAVARSPEYGEGVGDLFDEHDEIDEALDDATLPRQDGTVPSPADVPWPAVLAALDTLIRHIDKEEHGLFPAAAIVCDPADWEAADAVREARLLSGP